MRVFPIDKTLNKILDEAEEEFAENGVSRDQIREVFYYVWYHTKNIMRNLKFPIIIIPKWGRFVPRLGKVKGVKRGKENAGTTDTDTYKEVSATLIRLESENKRRKRKWKD